jgi:hypothetical protein
MVPQKLQRAVWATYQRGQEVRKDPSACYLVVQSIVVAHVARLEGRFTKDQYMDHVKRRLELAWHRLTDTDLDFLQTLVDG